MENAKLPAPRLELRWEQVVPGRWDNMICKYILVIPLQEFDIRRETEDGTAEEASILLSSTKSHGPNHRPVCEDGVRTPYRDGAHAQWDSKALGGLPIYAICEDVITPIPIQDETKTTEQI